MTRLKEDFRFHEANSAMETGYPTTPTGGDNSDGHSLRDTFIRLAVATVITCGSGGMSIASGESMTSDTIVYSVESQPTRAEVLKVSTVPQEVATIRHYLSLNVSNLATVLRIGRPTVYAWQRGEAKLHASNIKRLNDIYDLAVEWKKSSRVPLGNMLTSSLNDGSTFLESLSRDDIDPAELSSKVHELVEKREVILAGQGPRVRSLRSIADELGFSPMSPEEGQKSIDAETLHVRFPAEE